MSLKIKNKWQLQEGNRWDWQAFLDDEGSGEITEVSSVDYILHPTFPNPVRKVTTPENNFELKTNGWGTFEIKVFVNYKNGKRRKLTHYLKLESDPESGISD